MAKISIEFDTTDKSMSVSVDGKAVADVVEAYVSRRYYEEDSDAYSCCVTTSTMDEATDIRSMTRLCASTSAEGKAAAAKALGVSSLEEFVVAGSSDKVADDIAAYFKV